MGKGAGLLCGKVKEVRGTGLTFAITPSHPIIFLPSLLLLQIAEDLRQTFSAIFQSHKLTRLWAYKYDSQRPGINAHADDAAVNVNFWVTPNSANLDPDSG